jgi:hypothetical protein
MKSLGQGLPRLVGFVVCEGVAIAVGTGRPTLIGLFDVIVGSPYPANLDGAIVAVFSDVREPFDCKFQAVGFTSNKSFGPRITIATVRVEPPDIGSQAVAYVSGAIPLPLTGPGTAELLVYGNDQLMDTRPITVLSE